MRPISIPGMTRRSILASAVLSGFAAGSARAITAPSLTGKALVAITLDLEMSRNFPTWDQTHWDYEKGNLDAPTKGYAVEAARRVKASGGVIHFFAVGQTMEQEDVTLAARDRRGRPPGGQPHIRPRQRQGDALPRTSSFDFVGHPG